MKWKLALLALVILLALSISPVRAAEPQPYLYVMVKCSGLSLTQLEWAQQDFDTTYGWAHGLVTMGQWQASYEARTNEFASTLGCPKVLEDGALTFAYRLYVPTYSRILKNVPE